MKKRLLAAFLSLMMLVSLLPASALAVDEGTSELDGEPITSVSTDPDSPVQITKTLTEGSGEDNYNLSIEAYVTGNVQAATAVPMDIVLVLDVSGSMEDQFGDTEYQENYVVYPEWYTNENFASWENSNNLWTLLSDGTYAFVGVETGWKYLDPEYVSFDIHGADGLFGPTGYTNSDLYNEFQYGGLYCLYENVYQMYITR